MVDETEAEEFLKDLEKLNRKETPRPVKLREHVVKGTKQLPVKGPTMDRDSGISLTSRNSSFYDNMTEPKRTPKKPLKKLHWTKVSEDQAMSGLRCLQIALELFVLFQGL
jgi:hypothetical protein